MRYCLWFRTENCQRKTDYCELTTEPMMDSAVCVGFAGIRRSPSLLGLEHKLAKKRLLGRPPWQVLRGGVFDWAPGRRSDAVPAAQGFLPSKQPLDVLE